MQPLVQHPPAAILPAAELKKQATTWLLLSLASSLLCTSLCIGVVGAVFCYLAIQAAEQGAVTDAEAKLRWGKVLTISGSVLGVLVTTVSLLLQA